MSKEYQAIQEEALKQSLIKRLKEKLLINETNGCLEWTAKAVHNNGYGKISSSKEIGPLRAHRLVWVLEKGEIPDNLVVMHSCDNPKCCNIDHLRLGTKLENMQDMKNKGRHFTPFANIDWIPYLKENPEDAKRGEENGNSKLTKEIVLALRAFQGNHKEASLAFGISHSNAWAIRTYRAWKHIE